MGGEAGGEAGKRARSNSGLRNPAGKEGLARARARVKVRGVAR